MNNPSALTPRQRAFVTHYVTIRNGAEAARRAGYSERTARQMAHENLTKPDIQAALVAKEAGLAQEMDVSRERVIGELMAAVEDARTQANPGAAIRGWVEIAKMAGLYAPEQVKLILGAEGERLRAKMAAMTDEQLLAIAEGAAV